MNERRTLFYNRIYSKDELLQMLFVDGSNIHNEFEAGDVISFIAVPIDISTRKSYQFAKLYFGLGTVSVPTDTASTLYKKTLSTVNLTNTTNVPVDTLWLDPVSSDASSLIAYSMRPESRTPSNWGYLYKYCPDNVDPNKIYCVDSEFVGTFGNTRIYKAPNLSNGFSGNTVYVDDYFIETGYVIIPMSYYPHYGIMTRNGQYTTNLRQLGYLPIIGTSYSGLMFFIRKNIDVVCSSYNNVTVTTEFSNYHGMTCNLLDTEDSNVSARVYCGFSKKKDITYPKFQTVKTNTGATSGLLYTIEDIKSEVTTTGSFREYLGYIPLYNLMLDLDYNADNDSIPSMIGKIYTGYGSSEYDSELGYYLTGALSIKFEITNVALGGLITIYGTITVNNEYESGEYFTLEWDSNENLWKWI